MKWLREKGASMLAIFLVSCERKEEAVREASGGATVAGRRDAP